MQSCQTDAVPCCCHRTILDTPVTEQEFLEQLHELNNKINFAKELSFRETLACSDIQDIVDRLKLKVRHAATQSDAFPSVEPSVMIPD